MELFGVSTYLCPRSLTELPRNLAKPAWLAGGTWLFSEPQPRIETLVDLTELGWSELEVSAEGMTLGATCTLARLATLSHPGYPALGIFAQAIQALAASFKVVNVATVGGNLCLALPIGTLAPVMVGLGASYELWRPDGSSRIVAAQDFQTGDRQTLLQPGELLRRVQIPPDYLGWQADYRRAGITANDPALALVMAALGPGGVRIVIGASVAAPRLLSFQHPPSRGELAAALDGPWLGDWRASADYRAHLTRVLIDRSLQSLAN